MELCLSWNRNLMAFLRNRGREQPIGLINPTMSCYINSILQCLTYTPPLANYCLHRKHLSICSKSDNNSECPMCLLEDRIMRSFTVATVQSEAPKSITSNLRMFADYLSPHEQTDAQEFLDCVINACEESEKSSNSPNSKILNEIFESVHKTINRCSQCGNSSQADEIVNYFPLPLCQPDGSFTAREAVINLNESLTRYFTTEYLKGSTPCDKCKHISPISIERSISKPPIVLLLTLQRFWVDKNNFLNSKKITSSVPFPESLRLTQYLTSPHEREDYLYSLYAIIVHRGITMSSGHYLAYVKDADNYWFKCDDQNVSPATTEDVLKEQKNVYMLFYISQTVPKNDGVTRKNIPQIVHKHDLLTGSDNTECTLSVNSSDTTLNDGEICDNTEGTLSVNSSSNMSENSSSNKNKKRSLSPISTLSSVSRPATAPPIISMWKKRRRGYCS